MKVPPKLTKREPACYDPQLLQDVVQHLKGNAPDGTRLWFRHVLTHSQLLPYTSHPWEKFIAAERDAEALYTDPHWVADVLNYYSCSLDRSTHLLARVVVSHAMFDVLSRTMHKGT